MNPRYFRLSHLLAIFAILTTIPLSACDYNYISGCATTLNIEANGSSNGFQLSDCSYLTVFHNHDFGNVTSLRITEAKSISWESCSNNVFNARFYYRIYQQNATPGAFSSIELEQTNVTTFGAYRTRYREDRPNLNLLAGLPSGNYFIETYLESDVSFSLGNNNVDDKITKNNNGNFYRASFSVNSPQGSNLNLVLANQQNVTCNGLSNGSVTINTTNGTPPINYTWSNGAAGPFINNLSSGNYVVTATDALNQSGTFSIDIIQPSSLQSNLTTSNTSSVSVNDGSASVQPSGGTSPYSYSWSNGSNSSSINNLSPNTYGCTITDANGCSTTATAQIENGGVVSSNNYCVSEGDYPWLDWITKVKLNTVDHNSGKAKYSDFTDQSTDLVKGDSYMITIRNNYSWQTFNVFFKVWIDYNKNGIFEEPSEVAFQKNLPPPPLGTPYILNNGMIDIPPSASEGTTRMRVAIKRDDWPSPCETIPFGEVEDYAVNITGGGQTGCGMVATVNDLTCNDNGTISDPSDDTYGFNLLVNANSSNTNWSTPFNGQIYLGTYGIFNSISDVPIGNSTPFDLVISEVNNAACQTTISITPPPPCSNSTSNSGYCDSSSDFPWHDWIASVLFEDIDNFSDKTSYSDFTTISTNVNIGGTYPIALTSGFSWYTHNEYWKIWIDYNQNGIFEEPAEIAFSRFEPRPPNGNVDHAVFGNINIPSTANMGPTRMRIAVQRDIEPGPCDLLSFGEVEDYRLFITDNFTGGGENNLIVQLNGTPEIESINLYALVNTEKMYSRWVLEKTINQTDFIVINQGNAVANDVLFLQEKDNDPSNGQNHYRLSLYDDNDSLISSDQTIIPFEQVPTFGLFPNPSSGQFSIQLSEMAGKNVRIEIYNHLGQPMYRKVISEVIDPIHPIKTNDWKGGMYQVVVFPEKRKMVSKQIIIAK